MSFILKSCWRSNYLRFLFVLILTGSIAIGCGGGSDDPAPTDNTPAGTIDNSKFYGTYRVTMEIGDCEGPNTFLVEIGNDESRKNDEDGYLYIPLSANDDSWTFNDETKTISVTDNDVFSRAAADSWSFEFTMSFSADFQTAEMTGTSVETDPNECDGTVTGSATKVVNTDVNSDLSGTWDFYAENGVKTGTFILKQDGNALNIHQECGSVVIAFVINGSQLESFDDGADTVSATVNNDATVVNGVTCDEGSCDSWTLQKVSNATEFASKGSFAIQGSLCGTWIDLNPNMVCALKDYDDTGILDDIEIQIDSQYGSIGLEFESPDLLSSDTNYNLGVGTFLVDIQGTSIEDCFGADEIIATSGNVYIETYNSTTFKGTFDITVQGYQYTGSFDVNF